MFRVICSRCDAEDTFDGFVHPQAVDRAVKAGWTVDRATARRPAAERDDLCPAHHRPPRRPLP